MHEFCNILRELRLSRQLTQDELSSKLGISKSTISMYENGNREPDFETLEAIADFFNVDMNFLLGREVSSHRGYYLDEEAAKIAQEIFDNPDLRILFDTTRKVKPEDLKLIKDMVKRMSGEDD